MRRDLAPAAVLDVAVLGMGTDGHTASLFPGSPALAPGLEWVRVNTGPTVTPPDRLTLTAPFLSAARVVAVLVTGPAKRAMLARLAGRAVAPHEAPVSAIIPADGALRWFLDDAAAPPL